MTPRHDWKALVVQHARTSGAPDLPQHTIDELAAHLEDIFEPGIGDNAGNRTLVLENRVEAESRPVDK